MGIRALLGLGGVRAVQGKPPAGVRLPGVGNGYTGSKVGKIKVKTVDGKAGKHKKGK